MKRRVGVLYKTPIVEGVPNEVDESEILIQKNNSTGEIIDVLKRDNTGELKSVVVPKKNEEDSIPVREVEVTSLHINIVSAEYKVERVYSVYNNPNVGWAVTISEEDKEKDYIITIGEAFEIGHTLQEEDIELVLRPFGASEFIFGSPQAEEFITFPILALKDSILKFSLTYYLKITFFLS